MKRAAHGSQHLIQKLQLKRTSLSFRVSHAMPGRTHLRLSATHLKFFQRFSQLFSFQPSRVLTPGSWFDTFDEDKLLPITPQ
jgi:hypothetical protein